jgi:hypothetical protein
MSKMKLIMTVLVGVFALSAFAASSASAQWMVKGTTLSGTETRALAKTAQTDESALLKGAGIQITCKGQLEGTSPQIEASGEKGSAASLTFTECKGELGCTVAEKISTVPLLATIELAEAGNKDKALLLFTPKTKATFATIGFSGETCALEGTQAITGKADLRAPTGGLEATTQLIEANIAPTGELKIASSPAELKGKALLKLASTEPWSFLLP